MESPILPEETVISRARLADMQEELEKLRKAVEIFDGTLVAISNWPDGGARYGQGNIKRYATEQLNEARRTRWN
jgi:hypothetical protein